MKKILCLLCAVLILLVSCTDKKGDIDNSNDEIDKSETTTEQSEMLEKREVHPWTGGDILKNNFPTIDGSTSLIPLDVGIHSAIFGISREEAEKRVSHSKSWDAFYKLLKGECDVLLSVPLSDEQLRIAGEDYQFEPEFTAIAYEGFVFIVNINNPVNTLTQQQIKDIYSGKITNWKEVGGDDTPIIAYQRNADSGSQNYMIDFMGDTPLMYAPQEHIPGAMGGLIELVASYDNSRQAIGYSVYTYAADMYESGNNIKFIAVDGVKPTKATMGDETYPLVSYNYAIIDKNSPSESGARKLIEYLLSDEGQRMAEESGYVPIRETGGSTQISSLYAAKGTGEPAPKDSIVYPYYYTASALRWADGSPSFEYTYNNDGDADFEYDKPSYYEGLYTVTGLKDKALAAEIEKFIYDSIEELCSEEAIKQNKEFLKKSQPWGMRFPIKVKEVCKNGYYSIGVFSHYGSGADYPDSMFFDCRTVTYDLYTGKKLEFSDLFYKDADFVPTINNALSTDLSYGRTPYGILSKRITDIVALKTPIDKFMADSICLPAGNDIYNEGAIVPIPRQVEQYYAVSEPRDMKGLFDDDSSVIMKYYEYSVYEIAEGVKIYDDSVSNTEILIDYWRLTESSFITKEVADKLNATLENIINEYFTRDTFEKVLQERNIEYTSWNMQIDCSFSIVAGKYINLFIRDDTFYGDSEGTQHNIMIDIDGVPKFYTYWRSLYYNIDTGEPLTFDDLFSDGWQDKCGELKGKNLSDYEIFQILDYNIYVYDYGLYSVRYYDESVNDEPVKVKVYDKSEPENEKKYIELSVPREYIK